MSDMKAQSGLRTRVHAAPLLKQLGPGLITGAADDDPSGIATYSQGGAQFGFNLLWTMPLTFPLMAAIQMLSAEVGRVTGKGLAANMGQVMPRPLVLGLLANLTESAATTAVTIVVTTISPYLFFWQSAKEVEEVGHHKDELPLIDRPRGGPEAISRIRIDTIAGMLASNLVALDITIAT